MADVLYGAGKAFGMRNILDQVTELQLQTSARAEISTLAVTGATAFTTNATTGIATNDNALVFTIDVADITDIASLVSFHTATDELLSVDLDSTLTITHAGEATIAAGDLSISL